MARFLLQMKILNDGLGWGRGRLTHQYMEMAFVPNKPILA